MQPGFCAALVSVAALSVSGPASAAESVLYSFPANSSVIGQVQEDGSGNLYGTTGADKGYGTAYRLQQRQGVWRAKNIHVFNGSDGSDPYAGLTLNRTAAAFYGSAAYGGSSGQGVIFALSQTGHRWTESTLHTFAGTDGQLPVSLLTRDGATGTLYGATASGGSADCGTIYQLNPANGQFDVIHAFQGGTDGCNPFGQLRQGIESGTLIGTSRDGPGALFLLTEKGGAWKKTIIYRFRGGKDGASPYDLTFLSNDGTNSIYGVAISGGAYNVGVVFQITRPARKWQYRVIYNFTGGTDGLRPVGIHLDNVTGTLYGTTNQGGMFGLGTLFKLVSSGGKWTKTVLHDFGSGSDGAYPYSRPILDQQTGLLYGTTYSGGTQNGGTVYSVTP